jgi:spermidine/putrescine transport system substrate-binding protein
MGKSLVRFLILMAWLIAIMTILYMPKFLVPSDSQRSINIFSWGDILDPQVIASFENETGIKVNLSYYASNEELLVKMKATKTEGYDLIIPSDYAVDILIENSLLKPINKSKLPFFKDINPHLLGHYFDPENTFSIPLEWEVYGFGIDKTFFAKKHFKPSWNLIFNIQDKEYKISMTNDPIEAIAFAGLYLYNDLSTLTLKQASEVQQLLIKQKQWVEAYANFRGDYFLATKNCPVVVASSSYIWKTMRLFPFVSFVVPNEGTFMTIENLAIPIKTKKEEYTYQFINHLFKHESVKKHFEKFGFFPSTLQSLQDLEIDPIAKNLINASIEEFNKFHFLQELLPQQQLQDLWIEVKTSSS